MDLICYLHPGWAPHIRPAEATRAWMDRSHDSFAYRCLPLNIANAHGWEILSPCNFTAYWRGGDETDDVIIRTEAGTAAHEAPVSAFGHAVLTFHIYGIFRTPPGWNMFVTGSPNADVPHSSGIRPLSGVIETDWSPYSFTMNWRFTRRNHWVTFRKGDPICFLFPVQRQALEQFQPRFADLTDDNLAQFKTWSAARQAFLDQMVKNPPDLPSEKWQKHYYRGMDMHGRDGVADHKARLRLAEFAPKTAAPSDDAAPIVQLSGDVETIGGVLRIVAQGLARGDDAGVLAAGLQTLGASEADARAMIATARAGLLTPPSPLP